MSNLIALPGADAGDESSEDPQIAPGDDEVRPIRITSQDHHEHERTIHLADLMLIRGTRSVRVGTTYPDKLREDATPRERQVFGLMTELVKIHGVTEASASGYTLEVEFGEVFDPNAVMPEVLTLIIRHLGYKNVSLSEWTSSRRLWIDQVRTTPRFELTVPGININVEPADPEQNESVPPSGYYFLIIAQGGGAEWIKIPAENLTGEQVAMFMDMRIGQAWVAGLTRSGEDADTIIRDSLDRR